MEDLCLAEINKVPRNYIGQTLKTSKHVSKQRTIKKFNRLYIEFTKFNNWPSGVFTYQVN